MVIWSFKKQVNTILLSCKINIKRVLVPKKFIDRMIRSNGKLRNKWFYKQIEMVPHAILFFTITEKPNKSKQTITFPFAITF